MTGAPFGRVFAWRPFSAFFMACGISLTRTRKSFTSRSDFMAPAGQRLLVLLESLDVIIVIHI